MWVLLRPEPVAISTESTRIVVQADGHFNTIIRIAEKVAGFGDAIFLFSRLPPHGGLPAPGLGGGEALRLYPRMLAAALVVKSDATDGAGNSSGGSQALQAGVSSATGDPNNEDPEQEKVVSVKRPLRADDLGLKQENLAELRGQVSLEGKTLTVRVDMIKGATVDGKVNLEISGSSAIGNLRLLAKESGATTLRIEGTLANDRLLRVLAQRYGAQFDTVGGREILILPVT